MRGDFSTWNKEKDQNFNGVLHQQGRVLLDRDWNAQTEILNDWQETAGQDIIGAGVAAVPADAADSFKVTDARISADQILISVNKGRVWADGLLVRLNEDIVLREATYLQPPIQSADVSVADLPNDLRDAVILETWLEELNAFQRPQLLIEPALGGVDTTERVRTAFRFRLFRMEEDDTCDSIIERLKDAFENKGKLTAVLQPDTVIDGDCPVVEGGGYTGFEHQLYRIEVAQTRHTDPYFKWSQFNGGLVGRGRFDGSQVVITANLNAILHSGLTNFYMETLEEVEDGNWQVAYGARVTLDTGGGALNLPAAAADVFFGTAPVGADPVFFRLWNDIRAVADFASEADLQDGIRLEFDSTANDKFTPHDFWTFPVRAGGIPNTPTLVDNQPPEGIFYHRVPLAELFWRDDAVEEGVAEIEDCRRIFQPLTKLKTCCTYRVGDGVNSHGDFTSIQKAIEALPKKGGEICVLPGIFRENITLADPHNRNITIKGCGKRTQIIGAEPGEPVIRVDGGSNLRFESFAVLADDEGVGIRLEGDELSANNKELKILRNIWLENLQITAAARSAIEMHVGQFIYIRGCKIFIKDVSTEYAAVLLAGDDMLVEENEIRVMSGREGQWVKTDDPRRLQPAQEAAGGLHLSGGCERVRVINNLIMGGTGNGINLGNVDEMTVEGKINRRFKPWWDLIKIIKQGRCNPNPGEVPTGENPGGTIFVAGPPLRDILIERNRILCMGRNGIGVDGFFGFRTQNQPTLNRPTVGLELLSVENLVIIGNTINRCLNRRPVDISGAMSGLMGYGGISLSDVENLVVRDNFITENGLSHLNATCGIFVLHGEGVEISRNQIIDNGVMTEEQTTDQTVKNGMRGGVVILFGTQPMTANGVQASGIPVLFLRENVISVPMGRALTMIAIGDVSITGNRLTSQSLVPGFNPLNFMAGHILLFNLSVSLTLQAAAGFKNVSQGESKLAMQDSPTFSQTTAPTGASRTEARALRRKLMSGSTLFAHNQTQLVNQSDERGLFSALCAILIVGLDDVAFLGNRCNCALINDRLILDTFLFGITVRANDNYWQEIPGNVFLSAVTLGVLNTTTDNHSTHCILARGFLYLDRYNLTMTDLAAYLAAGLSGNVLKINKIGACESALAKMFPDFGKK